MNENKTSAFSFKKFTISFLTIFTLVSSTLMPSLNFLSNDNNIVYADEKKKEGSGNVEDTEFYYSGAQYQQAVIEANKSIANNKTIPPTIQEIINEGESSGSIKKNKDGKYEVTQKLKSSNSGQGMKGENMWTGYAKYIMGYGIAPAETMKDAISRVFDCFSNKPKKGESDFKNTTGARVKTGSNMVGFNLSDLSDTASHFDGNGDTDGRWLSRRISSTIGTFVGYHYIDTTDGTSRKELKSTLGESITAWISQGCVLLSGALDGITTMFSKILFAFDPYSWLGWGDGKDGTDSDNPFIRLLSRSLQSFGISKKTIKLLMDVGILVLSGLMCFVVLFAFKKGNLKSASGKLQNILLRILLLLVLMPLMASCAHNVSNYISEMLGKTKYAGASTEIVKNVLLDVEDWASSQNLSPTALNPSNKVPDSNAKENYLDTDFIPAGNRSLIKEINDKSEEILQDGATYKNGAEMLEAWGDGDTFTVLSYDASIKRNESRPLSAFASSAGAEARRVGDKPLLRYNKDTWIIASDLSSYIWSLFDTRDDVSKNSGFSINKKHKERVYDNGKKEETKEIYYQEQKPFGVDSNQSFSTQSVALMLQTAFDDNGEATFRALQISPSGLSKTQQQSSSPVAWRSVTMPNDSAFAKFSGCLYLIAFLLAGVIISCAVLFGLFYSGFFQGVIRWCKMLFKFMFTGDYGYATGTVCYYGAVILIGFFGLNLSAIVVNIVMGIGGAVAGLVSQYNQSVDGSVLDLVSSIAGIGLALFLSGFQFPFGFELRTSPIAVLLHAPLEWADQITEKMMKHSSTHNRLGSGTFGAYQGASSRGESSLSHKANNGNNGYFDDKLNNNNGNNSNSNANNNGFSNNDANGIANNKANNSSLLDKLNTSGMNNNAMNGNNLDNNSNGNH